MLERKVTCEKCGESYPPGWPHSCAEPPTTDSDVWRPIETAPKDGTKILLAKIDSTNGAPEFGIEPHPPYVWWCVQGYWSSKWGNWNDGVEPSGLAGPNFWMPTPAPTPLRGEESVCHSKK